jgi:BirA family biotin operon repressor/biotin-[acetyl-CoA-carboxylase] ligase
VSALRELQARLVHALGEAGGELPVGRAQALAGDRLAEALDDLGDLVVLGGDRLLRFARGSALREMDVLARASDAAFAGPIEIHPVVGSTNDVVLERATGGAEPGLVVVGELQTAGRGRRGRAFDSRPGLGVWASILLPDPADASRASRLSLIAALAVVDAIRSLTDAAPKVKWPNDVRLGGRKVCGTLVEARTARGAMFPVAGIGVNVHHRADDFPPELRRVATSVELATGRRVRRGDLLAEVLTALGNLVEREREGALDLPVRFAEVDEIRGRLVEIRGVPSPLKGHAAGIREDGALVLDGPGGPAAVMAGEVSLALAED